MMAGTAPSLSTIERGNPPPRRKSCAACIKAKRRCDLRQPSCLRCSQRKIECCYPAKFDKIIGRAQQQQQNQQIQQQRQTSISIPRELPIPSVQSQELMHDACLELDPATWETNFDFNFDLGPSYNPTCLVDPVISFDGHCVQEVVDFSEDILSTNKSLCLMPSGPGPQVALEEPLPLIMRSPQPMAATSSRLQLLGLISQLVETRLKYTINKFKKAPESFVLEGGTPWSHPALYRDSMPASLEDALGACALHRAKNSINSAMIQRVLEQRYRALLATPLPTTNALDLIAHTQALLLYQMILFFDDAWTGRTLAIETLPSLLAATSSLTELVRRLPEDNDDDEHPTASRNIPLYPPGAARALFHDWTIQESMRRTLLVCFLYTHLAVILAAEFTSTCDFLSLVQPSVDSHTHMAVVRKALKGRPCDDSALCDPQLAACRRITLSAYLWHSRDALEFAVAWREKKHLVAKPHNFWSRVSRARADDIDELGRMLMSIDMGMETARAWFASKGGSL